MKISYEIDNAISEIEPELLVIACDPRSLYNVTTYTTEENTIFHALENFTFYTTCLRVKPARKQDRVVVLDAKICGEMAGLVHGYRNETAKQWNLDVANQSKTNLITVYQIVRAGAHPSKKTLAGLLSMFLKAPPAWWPFEIGEHELVKVEENQPDGVPHGAINPLDTPYFDHFSKENLSKGLPWQWLDLQGENKTLYVHASTCFESVLHCWSYIKILMRKKNAVGALPADKTASIVILGAGVSGLLFAHELHQRGYTNVTLLEKSDRYAGKSHSLRVPDGDDGPSNKMTICELGTCYLSPAYDDMVEALSEFTVDNKRFECAPGTERGIVIDTDDGSKTIPISDYETRIACEYLRVPDDPIGHGIVDVALGVAVEQYLRIRYEIFGSLDGVMPEKQPEGDPHGIFSKSFAQFLDDNEMGVLKGYMLYAYEVQGYGALDTIPAYYGLVWITPDIAKFWGKDPGVTAWSKGWENVWEQMVVKLKMDVKLNCNVKSIDRNVSG